MSWATLLGALLLFVQSTARRNADSSPTLGVLSVLLLLSVLCCSPALLLAEISSCIPLPICSRLWVYHFSTDTGSQASPFEFHPWICS